MKRFLFIFCVFLLTNVAQANYMVYECVELAETCSELTSGTLVTSTCDSFTGGLSDYNTMCANICSVAWSNGFAAGAAEVAKYPSMCGRCNAGQYFDTSKKTCVSCPQGSYTNTTNTQLQCNTCADGTTNTATGNTSCSTSCAAGTYGKAGQCYSCPIGTYSDTTGVTACTPCPDGYTTPSSGSTSSSACSVSTSVDIDIGTPPTQGDCPSGFVEIDRPELTINDSCTNKNKIYVNHEVVSCLTNPISGCALFFPSGVEQFDTLGTYVFSDACPLGE